MINYSESGLYMEPYFTKVYNLLGQIQKHGEYELVEYNRGLFKAHYGNNSDEEEKEDDENDNEGEDDEELNNLFWEGLSYKTVYFKPLEYNEEIAFECGLIPFKYCGEEKELELLALGGVGMDLSPRLDAYQALTDGTIDKGSKLFSEKRYFQQVVGKELTEKVLKAICKEE